MILELQKISFNRGAAETLLNNGVVGNRLLDSIQSVIQNQTHRFYLKFKKKKMGNQTGMIYQRKLFYVLRLNIP